MKKFIYIFKSCRQYWPYALLTPIMMVGEAILELQIPGQISKIIDYLSLTTASNMEIKQVLIFGIYLLGFSLLSLICGTLGGIFAARAASGFAANLKNDMYRKIQSFSFNNIDKYSSSSLITRMTTDANWLQNAFQMSIRLLFRTPTLFSYALIKAYSISKSLSFLYLIAIPILIVILLVINIGAFPLFGKGIKQIDNLNQIVEENVRGIRAVKSFTIEKNQIETFDKTNGKIYEYFSKASKLVQLNNPAMMIAIYALIVLIALFGVKLIGNGLMSSGSLYELITYAINILSSLMMFTMIIIMFVIAKPSSDRVYEILKEESTIKNPISPIMEVPNGDIEFDHVFFKYNASSERYVLDDVNFKIKSGETIGILGTTGSSKSTLVSLIARLYDATKGEVKVGDINVKNYDIKQLRDEVSVVLQKNELFSGTIRENMQWGRKDASDEEILKALDVAQAKGFVEEMPNGLDSVIEQGGTNVSGGQKQRLCIARALLKNPKILIFDDSTSAVDTKTDALIRDGLKDYMKGVTKIVIAQRYLSVIDADKIMIIDDGKIVDIGSHEELLKTSPIYQEVFNLQNKGARYNE